MVAGFSAWVISGSVYGGVDVGRVVCGIGDVQVDDTGGIAGGVVSEGRESGMIGIGIGIMLCSGKISSIWGVGPIRHPSGHWSSFGDQSGEKATIRCW